MTTKTTWTWTTTLNTSKGEAAMLVYWNSKTNSYQAQMTCTGAPAPEFYTIHAAFDPSMKNTAVTFAKKRFADFVNEYM